MVDKCTDVQLKKCLSGKMSIRTHVRLTKCPNEKMSICTNVQQVCWYNKLTQCGRSGDRTQSDVSLLFIMFLLTLGPAGSGLAWTLGIARVSQGYYLSSNLKKIESVLIRRRKCDRIMDCFYLAPA